MLPQSEPDHRRVGRSHSRSWYAGESCGDVSTSSRAATTRSWYGGPGPGYGALSEEDLHSPTVTPARSGGRIDLLKSLVSMASLSRRRSSSATALHSVAASAAPLIRPRKCETVVALSSLQVEPVNRLRYPSRVCSRCSSLLSMASSSRYSINTTGGFVQVNPPTPFLCKLCLIEVPTSNMWTSTQCSCTFCLDCMRAYVEFEIAEGAYDISCPDALCEKQGVISMREIEDLVSSETLEKHKRFRLNREVELDKSRTWCPRAGCETVCTVCSGPERCVPQSVHCPTCSTDFCSNCRAPWHQGVPCRPEDLAAPPVPGVTFDSELIKCCPMCAVPIEKDEGCAQMMCKRCKHVFCWYCLASLDDDFLLRHYDKGPCKNKLGHSRASVIWHRTQVIGIFAGFGILLLVASPLLLLAAPCIVCCKCRVCSGGGKLDPEDDIPEES
ncbi:putative E3 ubiquitin-protein ligase RNF144A [Lycorma delicatula]|uniref:putative E3 ubiquitin-protein ligase RNF144A n=1 Tax=Lycorma delicatula TaxID=130591 RepID=UPI003F50E561